MTATVITLMLVALYLTFCIALSMRPPKVKKGDDSPQERRTDISEVVVKSRFVRPESGQSKPTPARASETDFQKEKHSIFALGNGKGDAVIPSEKLDEVFGEEPSPEDLDIEPDENVETDEPDVDLKEEAEDLLRMPMPEGNTDPAKGFSFEEMAEAAESVVNPTDEKGEILYRVEKTDMFERLVSGDREKAERIKAIIDRHTRSRSPEVESDNEGDNDWKDFDIRNFLSKQLKSKTE